MKKLLSIILILYSLAADATTYYVNSLIGNDSNPGTISQPWRTSTKVNSFTFASGDQVLFAYNGTYDAVTVNRSNISFGAIGTGTLPLITAEQTLTFTSAGNGLFEATVNTTDTALAMVTLNGLPQAIGRYPNEEAPNGGYLVFESFNGTYSITDNQLNNTINWKGAEVVIRKNFWTAERHWVAEHNGSTIVYNIGNFGKNGNYNNPQISVPTTGNGYFFQNDLRTLDKLGEWYFNKTTKKLYMFFGGAAVSSYVVKVATKRVLLNINTFNNITVRGLRFAYSTASAIYCRETSNIRIASCSFENIGEKAVQGFNVTNGSIDSCNANWCLLSGFQWYSNGTRTNVSVRNSIVTNVGVYVGLGPVWDASDQIGIYASANSGVYVARNYVQRTGRDCIKFQGSNVYIDSNSIWKGDSVLHDQGMIYTWAGGTDAAPGQVYTQRFIRYNIVGPGVGNAWGCKSSGLKSTGVYLDGRTMNVEVAHNVIFGQVKNGFHTNNGWNIYVHDNIFYNCDRSISLFEWSWGSLKNIRITNNQVYSSSAITTYVVIASLEEGSTMRTVQDVLEDVVIDSNWYNKEALNCFQIERYDSIRMRNGILSNIGYQLLRYTLPQWRSAYGFDANSIAYTDFTKEDARFYYNDSTANKVVNIPGSITPKGVQLSGNQTIVPYSALLAGPYTVTTPPDPPPTPPGSTLPILFPYQIKQ